MTHATAQHSFSILFHCNCLSVYTCGSGRLGLCGDVVEGGFGQQSRAFWAPKCFHDYLLHCKNHPLSCFCLCRMLGTDIHSLPSSLLCLIRQVVLCCAVFALGGFNACVKGVSKAGDGEGSALLFSCGGHHAAPHPQLFSPRVVSLCSVLLLAFVSPLCALSISRRAISHGRGGHA